MVKSVANAVTLVAVVVLVISVGAIALRIYSLACRLPRARPKARPLISISSIAD